MNILPLMLKAYTKNICNLVVLMLIGCSSAPTEQFNTFIGDPLATVYIDDKKVSKPIHINVVMSKGNNHSESCRSSGTVSLPDNMNYSSYLQQIITNSLYLSDRLAKTTDLNAPRLKIEIKYIDFQSYAGQWAISGIISINEQQITAIESLTTFKAEFDNDVACSEAINSFDNLCRDFIMKVLYAPKVMQAIKKS